jgi:hypothetical protein
MDGCVLPSQHAIEYEFLLSAAREYSGVSGNFSIDSIHDWSTANQFCSISLPRLPLSGSHLLPTSALDSCKRNVGGRGIGEDRSSLPKGGGRSRSVKSFPP